MVECQLPKLTPLLILLRGLTFLTQERVWAPFWPKFNKTWPRTQDCFGDKLIVCLAAAKMARQNRAPLK